MYDLAVGSSDGSSSSSWQGPAPGDPSTQKRFSSGVVPPAALIFLVLVFVAGAIVTLDHKEVRALLCTFTELYCR